MDPGSTRGTHEVAIQLNRVRGGRQARRPTARVHHRRGTAASRHLRRQDITAHHPVRPLLRLPATRVRLPHLWSPPLTPYAGAVMSCQVLRLDSPEVAAPAAGRGGPEHGWKE